MKSPWVRVVLGIAGVIGLIAGGMQFSKGLKEMFSAGDMAKVQEHAQAGDALNGEGNTFVQQAGEADQLLWPSIDQAGFPDGRDKVSGNAERISGLYKQSAEKFRAAAKQYEAGSSLTTNEDLKKFLTTSAQAGNALADAQELLAARVELVLDSDITSMDQLLAKIEEMNAKITAQMAKQQQLEAQAKEMLESIKKR